ncbi:MAG TPA: TetR/AcrR family transcriptional regulator [Saprospiraceae bacterium]|nr:TetR/AcrR family transcriptional regulator [Saprospiraceae bacterium]HMQ82098.1 TetR/AcrR family transcriptional regulator [Saprospiraceae bacterium]
MSTKVRILETALSQFNEYGLANVSIRSISQAIAISPGNLTYHYKNIEAIVEALYMQLVATFDQRIAQIHTVTVDMAYLMEQTRANMHTLFEYRFLLLDFPHVARRIPTIQQHFHELVQSRLTQFALAFELLVAQDILQPERLPGTYKRLIYNLIIITNAWPSDSFLHFQGGYPPDKIIDFYTVQTAHMLLPYLTEKGQQDMYYFLRDLEAADYPD